MAVVVSAALVVQFALSGPVKAQQQAVTSFESEPKGWGYVGGQEFPGAKGSLEWDEAVAHQGKGSLRLHADFTKGGLYVGLWKDVDDFKGGRLQEIRLWVKSQGVVNVGVRLLDDTGQCHQKKDVPLAATDKWQELVLAVGDIAGGEHWGGANDGKWHGPPKGFGLNIGITSVGQSKTGTLWIDDVSYTVASGPSGVATALPCQLTQTSCRPGYGTYLTYRWDAVPMGTDYKVFVHVRDAKGNMLLQNDHTPPGGTAVWSGRVQYQRTIVIPTTAAEGRYDVILGIYDSRPEGGRQPIKAGPGAVIMPNDPTAVKVGTITVDAKAPIPKLTGPKLNLDGYKLTFDEDFKGPLDVSAWGPGTRWIAHTPYAGDFGDARFTDPEKGFPFTIDNGVLRIEARKDNGKWRSGLLSSVDPNGNGFSQKYGYFEMRAKLPKGPGTWPAFWLLGVERLRDKSVTNIEIDVVEQYGINPNALCTNVHLWYADGRHTGQGKPYIVTGMTDDFHTYGVLVDEKFITFYYDRCELGKISSPAEANVPLYLLVNLALGSGWPIDKTPNPSYMYVDYVRAYARVSAQN